ncbi:hypothetical protein GW7_09759, partial [Heterocephalus glaber]
GNLLVYRELSVALRGKAVFLKSHSEKSHSQGGARHPGTQPRPHPFPQATLTGLLPKGGQGRIQALSLKRKSQGPPWNPRRSPVAACTPEAPIVSWAARAGAGR